MAKKKTNEETKEEEIDDSTPNASADTHHVSVDTDWQKVGKDPDAMFPALMEMVSGLMKSGTEMPKSIMVSFERASGRDMTRLNFTAGSIEEAAAMIRKAMETLPEAKVSVLTVDDLMKAAGRVMVRDSTHGAD